MAVLSRTKNKTRLHSRAAVEEEVETKAEAKKQAVVVPKPLAEIVSKWGNAQGQADMFFVRVVNLVIEQDFDRPEVYQALIDHRGMKPVTANTEASVIMRVKKYPNEVAKCLKGKITVRELRDIGKNKQAGSGDPEKRLPVLLRNSAKFAIMECGYEKSDFVDAAKTAYTAADAAVLRAKQKAEAEGQAPEDEEVEDEEMEDQLEEGEEEEEEEEEE